jgi:hypothetical protein
MILNAVDITCFNSLTSNVSWETEANNEKPQSGYAVYPAHLERILQLSGACLKLRFTGQWRRWICLSCDRDKFLIMIKTRYTNFSNIFWKETLHVSDSSSVHHQEFFYCTHSNGIRHTGLLTACKLSANLYDIYHCCVYNEKLLMMERETVRNM